MATRAAAAQAAALPPGQIINPRSGNVNEMGINQLAVVLNSIVQQATGQKVLTPTDTSSFISVAQMGLMAGYDSLLESISQVLSKTIFSVRPYNAKMVGLQRDARKWGNHVRKLNMIDDGWEEDNRFDYEDGDSVDMYKIRKPKVLQTNFYGQNVWKRHITIFRDQIDTAFSSPDEFGRFISMVMSNISDLGEQCKEMTARYVINNLIAGKIDIDSKSVIHLLSEYNSETGLALTGTSVYQPDNYGGFIRWVYSRIATLSDMLTDRSVRWHVNIEGKTISRHTPVGKQQLYVYSPIINRIRSTVLADTYHDTFLRMDTTERINFWQSADSGAEIQITPAVLDVATGLVKTGNPITQQNVFGVLMDYEAAGITVVDNWMARSPFNADGGYSNIFWHSKERFWNDFTENAIVLLMD